MCFGRLAKLAVKTCTFNFWRVSEGAPNLSKRYRQFRQSPHAMSSLRFFQLLLAFSRLQKLNVPLSLVRGLPFLHPR